MQIELYYISLYTTKSIPIRELKDGTLIGPFAYGKSYDFVSTIVGKTYIKIICEYLFSFIIKFIVSFRYHIIIIGVSKTYFISGIIRNFCANSTYFFCYSS